MIFEKIYNMVKPSKKEYTEYSYLMEIENHGNSTLEKKFSELEEICEDFNLSAQEICDDKDNKEIIYFQKNVLEMENYAHIENSKAIFETHLKFEKGKEIPWLISRVNSFYKDHKTL